MKSQVKIPHLTDIREVYTRENKPQITKSAACLSRELSRLYEHGLCKKLVRGLRKPRTSFLCRLYEQFAAYIHNPRLIFTRINGPIVTLEIYNAFQCNIALSKHAASWQNTSSVGKHEAQPSGSQRYPSVLKTFQVFR